jgi:hypothetical protein
MSLKDEILEDIDNVFLNFEDFAEEHTVEGEPIMCIFDDDELKERQGTNELGVENGTILLFAKSSDLPPRRVPNEYLEIDGKNYVIDDWRENLGMAEIILHHGESYGGR